MLQSMRQMAHSWVVKALMILLVVSFGIWGIGDIFRGNPLKRTVAKAGSTVITVQDLNREFEQTLAQARRMMGPDLTARQAKQIGLLDNALNALIERATVDQATAKLGIEVSAESVIRQMASLPQFQDKDGKFDKQRFRDALRQAQVGEHNFIEQERLNLSRHQLVDVFLKSAATKPQRFIVDTLAAARGQKRVLDVIAVSTAAMADIPEPDDKALREFYRQHDKLFTAPEYRALTVASLSTEDMAKDIAVTDEQVRKEYDEKGDQMARPERRDLLQTVLQDEGKAKLLAEAARASHDLASAAKHMGYDTVPLPQTDASSLLPELSKPLFALNDGDISAPIKSPLGWHVMQVRKIYPAGKPAFESVAAQLRDTMKRDQAIETASRLVNTLDDNLAANHGLEDIADSLKLRLVKIPPVDAGGNTADGKPPAEFPYKQDVLKAAFNLNAGETSPIMDDKNGNYYVVRVDDVTPSGLKSFESVARDAAAAWKADEQTKKAAAEAETIAQGLRDGKTASTFAAQKGVDIRVSRPISLLGDHDDGLPPTLDPQILKMKKGEVIVAPLPGKQMVLRLIDVIAATPQEIEAARPKIAAELADRMPGELLDAYLRYLRVVYPVKINHDVLESIARQGDGE